MLYNQSLEDLWTTVATSGGHLVSILRTINFLFRHGVVAVEAAAFHDDHAYWQRAPKTINHQLFPLQNGRPEKTP